MIFPETWKKYLPEHLHKWIGRLLPLKKALHGHNYSGKFLTKTRLNSSKTKALTNRARLLDQVTARWQNYQVPTLR